jgi:hypothetical protein
MSSTKSKVKQLASNQNSAIDTRSKMESVNQLLSMSRLDNTGMGGS